MINFFSFKFSVNLNTSTSGYYNVNLNFFRWLQSAPTYFIVDGTRYNLSDKSLYSNASYGGNGVDEFGFYQSIRYRYYVGKTIIDCSINTYDTGNHIVFEQVSNFIFLSMFISWIIHLCNNLSISPDKVINYCLLHIYIFP